MTAELVLTGERTLPGIAEENYWFRRHEAAYLALAPFTTGAVVLEAGCGEGYGAALLATGARRVLGLDYDATTARHAGARYAGAVDVVQADLQRLPLRDGAVEVVASLQTLEHLHDQPGFLRECARALRPAGTLLLTTPNRLTFSPGRDVPLNPFHTCELAPDELRELLVPDFEVLRHSALHHGPRLRRWEGRHGPLVDALLATPPPDWSPTLARLVASVTAADFVVTETDPELGLDLVAVAIRR